MADAEHVELLLAGVDSWTEWRRQVDPSMWMLPRLPVTDHMRGKRPLRTSVGEIIDLRDADLSGSDLTGVDLAGVALDGANLRGAVLAETNLTRASLVEADLTGARLHGARLSATELAWAIADHADFTKARLVNCGLESASLVGANLAYADLEDIDMRATDLSGAALNSTGLREVDFSLAIGLGQVRHFGPSSVDTATLYLTGTPIPRDFYLGCGIDPLLIDHLEDFVDPLNIAFYRAFISYNSSDSEFAGRLHDTLRDNYRIPAWLDKHQIVAGEKIPSRVHTGIDGETDRMIVVLSEQTLQVDNRGWIERELDQQFQKEADARKEGREVHLVIPVLLDNYLLDGCRDWYHRAQLVERLGVIFYNDSGGDWTDETVWKRGLDGVVNGLRRYPLRPSMGL